MGKFDTPAWMTHKKQGDSKKVEVVKKPRQRRVPEVTIVSETVTFKGKNAMLDIRFRTEDKLVMDGKLRKCWPADVVAQSKKLKGRPIMAWGSMLETGKTGVYQLKVGFRRDQ